MAVVAHDAQMNLRLAAASLDLAADAIRELPDPPATTAETAPIVGGEVVQAVEAALALLWRLKMRYFPAVTGERGRWVYSGDAASDGERLPRHRDWPDRSRRTAVEHRAKTREGEE